jgi:hypothetical protein
VARKIQFRNVRSQVHQYKLSSEKIQAIPRRSCRLSVSTDALPLTPLIHLNRRVRVREGCGASSAMPDLGAVQGYAIGRTEIDSDTNKQQRDAR